MYVHVDVWWVWISIYVIFPESQFHSIVKSSDVISRNTHTYDIAFIQNNSSSIRVFDVVGFRFGFLAFLLFTSKWKRRQQLVAYNSEGSVVSLVEYWRHCCVGVMLSNFRSFISSTTIFILIIIFDVTTWLSLTQIASLSSYVKVLVGLWAVTVVIIIIVMVINCGRT